MRKMALSVAMAAALCVGQLRDGQAQDASFGCKVLLCAAASAPGWPAIPYCVPVMQTLFRQLARGKGWPSCPEANAGGVGYDPYLNCPAGLSPVFADENVGGVLVANASGNLCADLSRESRDCANGIASCSANISTSPRPQREEQHYVDISTPNGVQRFYFSLRGY